MVKKDLWEEVIKQAGLDLTQPVSFISARDVKRFANYEPRLLAKTDSESDLPQVFRRNDAFLLPTSRGGYAIVKGRGYHHPEPISTQPLTHEASVPPDLESVLERKETESIALDYAYETDLLRRFLGLQNLYHYIRGRIDTVPFSFKVDGSPEISVEGAQIELDASYIGNGDTSVVEAKIGTPETFWVKQLYYPYRHLSLDRPESKIRCVFFAYEPKPSRMFSLWEYEFTSPTDYESINLVRSERYQIKVRPIEVEHLVGGAADLTSQIPQADSFDKVIQFPIYVSFGFNNSLSMARAFDFTTRQSSYYRQASQMLGLVDMKEGKYALTEVGRDFIDKTPAERTATAARLLLRHPIVRELYERVQWSNKPVTRADVIALIQSRSKLSGTVLPRRAQTIFKWFEWLQHSTGTVRVNHVQISRATPKTLDEYTV